MNLNFEVDAGLQISATALGNSSDDLVVLLHGGGQTRHAWGATTKKLSECGFYTLAIDLRGHGDSDWCPNGDYAIENFRDDLVSIIKQIDRPASLVGASLGGMISLSLAGDESLSKHCNALIMVDIGINPNEDGSNEILNFMRSGSDGFGSIEEASDAISKYLPHRQKPKDLSGLKKNLRLKYDGKYYWHWDPQFIDSISKDKISYRKRLKSYANFVRVPTLLIKGALSNVLTQQEVDDFLITIPHTEFVEIDKAAHMVAGDRNDIFASAAVSFLANLDRTR
tara:strand:+ start:366 stop:1211 length:846 start_codon:yes stop_codon:yes gene_type:complete